MKSKYKHLTIFDRQTIEIQLNRWTKHSETAKILGKHKSTISREIKLNSVVKRWKKWKEYLAKEAHLKAYLRRYYCKTQSMKINMNTKLRLFIIYHLRRKDIIPSPKIIAKLWNNTQDKRKNHITHTSIYSWLETGMWNKYKELLLYKYKWYKKVKAVKWCRILWRIGLDKRSEKANNRTEQWHFEADLIVSPKWFKWALLTLIDRKTRLPKIFKLKDKRSKNIMKLIARIKEEIWIKSVTFDNWMEFAKHQLLNHIWINTYFCEPYHSREKWSIENLNRIIRRFFPKWTIFDDISRKKIRSICNIIANTPREILGFVSPNQVHFS
jgi:IS30 family transposase